MGLPNLKTVRINEIKIGKKKVKIQPWTNRQVIQYEHVRDEVLENETFSDDSFRRERISELLYKYLVKPNIDFDKAPTLLEREILFVEMYRISRGNVIPLKYKCDSCGTTNEIYFDLTKHFKIVPMKTKELEINGIVFKLSDTKITVDELKNMEDTNVKYILSYIREIDINGDTFKDFTLDELYNWFMDELDETTFTEFFDKIFDMIPKIEMGLDVECVKCGNQESFVFTELPDFSLMRSSKAEE